ncbi:methylmalonyl Co-A mutase-associated GTPase MeaB [Urechidicola sp. KH5]
MQNFNSLSANQIVDSIQNGNITALSRAITLVESTNPKHQNKATKILEQCYKIKNNSLRIGITGVPGVGKSTFIEALGKYYLKLNKKIAILAVDPSSTLQGGSILGDKTRMEILASNNDVFIRPSPAGNTLGGVARNTREAILLCETAGYEIIIIETVGVGQSEWAVHNMVDFFLLLKLANAGDELQGIKRGIIEMADAIVINKADGVFEKQALLAKLEFERALHLFPPKENNWTPQVATCSALNNKGIEQIALIMDNFFNLTKKNEYFCTRRNKQAIQWFLDTLKEGAYQHFLNSKTTKNQIENVKNKIQQKELHPFIAAKYLLKNTAE